MSTRGYIADQSISFKSWQAVFSTPYGPKQASMLFNVVTGITSPRQFCFFPFFKFFYNSLT